MDNAHRDRSTWWIIGGVCCVAAVVALILLRVVPEASNARKEAVAIGISAAQLPGSSVEPDEPMAAEEPVVAVAEPVPPAPSRETSRPTASKRGQTIKDIVRIESAVEHYAINNSMRYPDSLEVLVTPDVNGATYFGARTMPKDPWGRDYVYEPPVPGRPQPRIGSLGADGREGGTGDDEDLDNLKIREPAPR